MWMSEICTCSLSRKPWRQHNQRAYGVCVVIEMLYRRDSVFFFFFFFFFLLSYLPKFLLSTKKSKVAYTRIQLLEGHIRFSRIPHS